MRKVFAIISVLIVGVVLGAGTSYATIPASDGTINGCYRSDNPGNGALYIIDSEETCPTGFTALNWNQNGFSGYEIVTATKQVDPPTNRTSIQVDCPIGKIALGGGGSAPVIETLRPTVNGTGWFAQGSKRQFGSSGPLNVSVWATCVNG